MIGRFIHTMSIMYAGESAAVHFFPSLLSHRQIVPLSHTLTMHLHTQTQQFSSLLTTAGSGIMYLRSIFADGCLSNGCDTPRVGESVRPVFPCVCVCVCCECVCVCVVCECVCMCVCVRVVCVCGLVGPVVTMRACLSITIASPTCVCEIGCASCRVCVEVTVSAVSLKKQ